MMVYPVLGLLVRNIIFRALFKGVQARSRASAAQPQITIERHSAGGRRQADGSYGCIQHR